MVEASANLPVTNQLIRNVSKLATTRHDIVLYKLRNGWTECSTGLGIVLVTTKPYVFIVSCQSSERRLDNTKMYPKASDTPTEPANSECD